MSNFLKRNLKGDPVVWMIWFLIILVSVLELFSASSALIGGKGTIARPILRHVMFLTAGFGVMLITQLISIKYLRILGYVGVFISFFLLLYTWGFAQEKAGAARFLEIGGFQFQPSEIARLSLIIVAADLIDRFQNKEVLRKAYWVFIFISYPILFLIFTENLSSVILIGAVLTAMMFVGTIPFKRIAWFVTIPVVLIVMILGIAMMVPEESFKNKENPSVASVQFYKLFKRAYTWIPRLESFGKGSSQGEEKYTTIGQYQFAHAQIAVARGGTFPNMPGSSVQRNYLPEAYSDFIFAIIVEELGLIGGIVVMMLYLFLLYRAGVVARRSPDVFSAILVIGVTLIMVLQAFVHIAVCAGLIPLTGQPLPLISNGGTSIMVNSVYLGIIIAITRTMYNNDGTIKETKSEYAPAALLTVDEPVPDDEELMQA